jgi:Immunity protein 42
MIFGRPSEFAIEAVVLDYESKWIFGNFRFYVSNLMIGLFEESSDLAASARWGRTFLAAATRRKRTDLDSLSAKDVFYRLYGRYIVEASMSISEQSDQSNDDWDGEPYVWDRDPYLLDSIGESALRDRNGLIVVKRADGCDRVIANSFRDGSLFEYVIHDGVVDHVVDSYCTWVETLPGGGG